MAHLRFFAPCKSAHSLRKVDETVQIFSEKYQQEIKIDVEFGFHLVLEDGICAKKFKENHGEKVRWLLASNPFDLELLESSQFQGDVLEVGPRLTFKTAFCTNALSAFDAAGITEISRIERTMRYSLNIQIDPIEFLEISGDRMTECIYSKDFTFAASKNRCDYFEIDVLGDSSKLDKANSELGLAFDENDLKYYKELFIQKFKRNPTDVELFDLAQSDSEHSRHWFFRGNLVIDGETRKESLMSSIRATQTTSNPNNLIAFCDNSSAIRGFDSVTQMIPEDSTKASRLQVVDQPRHVIYSAETHNFPTAVCPFQGATTGTGGRIRDIHATGKGAHEIAGVAGYSFGNLHLDGYQQPWEDEEIYPSGFSHPRQIAIEASNGASDYGNKFGEPVICGFTRSFGQRLPDGERCEYVKPIMFSGGLGAIDEHSIHKESPKEGQLLAKIGGPVYRIGVGGGAASSLSVQGSRESSLDFGAVQRGDAEMEQKLHRIVRACVEQKENPILAIHDQGAGGNGNVLKELVEGAGAVINANAFELGDDTISARELWTAEYQENDACTFNPALLNKVNAIAKREKCTVSVVGEVTNEQRVVLTNFDNEKEKKSFPVDFDTRLLGEREKKTFRLSTKERILRPLELPSDLTLQFALPLVLRLPSVASKRYLTCKVDRSVTGLVAQQQNVGPLHTPLADVAVVALSHFEKTATLEFLSLRGNLLADWPFLPMKLSMLKSVSFASNILTSLPPHALVNFPSLQHLDLSNNQISEIDRVAFPSVGMRLVSLDLSGNQLTVLPHTVLPSLLYFDASGNDLGSIDPILFSGMPQLQHLRLSNNPSLFFRCGKTCWSDHLDELTEKYGTERAVVGAAVAVGEQPIKMLVDNAAGARMTVAETLTNLVFAPITDLKDVKISGNWMWAAKCEGEGAKLVATCDSLCDALGRVGCAIDGGKDSLSMAAMAGGELIKAPGTLVLSAYVTCPDVTKVLNPAAKGPQTSNESETLILYVRMGSKLSKNRLGGTALAQVFKQIGNESPDVEDFEKFVAAFEIIQDELKKGTFLSGHDISDGGLITSLLEMAFAGNVQLKINISSKDFGNASLIEICFAEESGVLLEIDSKNIAHVQSFLNNSGLESVIVGSIQPKFGPDAEISLMLDDQTIFKEKVIDLREIWEETGDRLGLFQTTKKALEDAKNVRHEAKKVQYKSTFKWELDRENFKKQVTSKDAPKVAIIREEGSNGDREMAAAFALAGFQTFDVTMTDLLDGHSLKEYSGIAFVGGFSYADVLGSAKGWAASIRYHEKVSKEFEDFRKRRDTFSFGVCNGCQLMALLGWIGDSGESEEIFLAENECGRFESVFGPCKIEESNSIMLKGMHGSVLGLWSSHGEGQFTYRNPSVYENLEKSGSIALRYVDHHGEPTQSYPWNPNGSANAVAGICSDDGRHLAMMPHSDRSFLQWQWADYPIEWRNDSADIPVSPWIKMFQNAFDWVQQQRN